MSSPIEYGEGIKDLYESEKVQIKGILNTMNLRYREPQMLTGLEEIARRAKFARELQERIAEVGFVGEVIWEWQSEERHPEDPELPLHQSPDTTDVPGDMSLIYNPKLVISGRTAKLLDFDHEQQKFEVREGTFDGVKGVIDPNTGLMKDDAKKKTIY
jgi:hypothetical protein